MHWSSDGIVLAVRRHGETAAIAELLTRNRGRCLGLVRGGRSRAMRPVLQPGNQVHAVWRARLEEHLGQFTMEPKRLKAAGFMDYPFRLAGLSTVTGLARVLPEREPHERLYDALLIVIDALEHDDVWPALLARWEVGLLEELGFGLDLARCAVTGGRDDLVYVSPKSGRAVSDAAGKPYHHKLLILPRFLQASQAGPAEPADLLNAFSLTGYFLYHHVFEPRGIDMPDQRAWIIRQIAKKAQSTTPGSAISALE